MASLMARNSFVNTLRFINFPPAVQVLVKHSIKPTDYRQIVSIQKQCNYSSLQKSCLFRNIAALNKHTCATKPERRRDGVAADEKTLSLFQRFKQMYRDYWYVLVPVHLITSAGWMGGFYYMAKSGIDVVAIMESYNISERITNPLKDSSLGYLAIAYALYKIATPVRYTVTLGGTTISINYLKKWGYIKPVPTREQLREIYKEKKDNILYTMKDTRAELRLKKEKLKDRTDNLLDNMETKIIKKINHTKKKRTSANAIKTIEKP